MIAAVQIGTAYSNKDMEFALRRLKGLANLRSGDDDDHMTAEEVTRVLREFPELLTLEKDNELSQVSASVSTVLKDTLALDDMKSELCNRKKRTSKNALFWEICISAEMVDSLKLGVDLLAGPKEISLGKDSNQNDVRIVMDLTKILKSPPADLKALLPVSFDNDGNPETYPDPTMAGLFPNGDLIEKLEKLAGGSLKHKASETMRGLNESLKSIKGRI
jgi:hypothetical protein